MGKWARIEGDGAWATLTLSEGDPQMTLRDILSVLHPDRHRIRAYVEGRWDGMVDFHRGSTFPAGHTRRVAKRLREDGYHVTTPPVERLGRVKADLLRDRTLRDYQVDAVNALLRRHRGMIRGRTGCGKTLIAVALAVYLFQRYGWRSTLVTSRVGVVAQTYRAFLAHAPQDMRIGRLDAAHKSDGDVIVTTGQSLTTGLRTLKQDGTIHPACVSALGTEVLIADECHRSRAESWSEALLAHAAKVRYGMSGTPLVRSRVSDLRIIGAVGPVVHTVSVQRLHEGGYVRKAHVIACVYRSPHPERIPGDYAGQYDAVYVSGPNADYHNRLVARTAELMLGKGWRSMLLCFRRDQQLKIATALSKLKRHVSYNVVNGDTPLNERDDAKHRFAMKEIDLLLASSIFDEGEDMPSVDGLVLAEGVKAFVKTLQRLGRAMRGKGTLLAVELIPADAQTVAGHAVDRVTNYEREGHRVDVVEGWDALVAAISQAGK